MREELPLPNLKHLDMILACGWSRGITPYAAAFVTSQEIKTGLCIHCHLP
jgi:hypothetical protein